MTIPAAVSVLLREPVPATGSAPMFPLLTTGTDGDVHVCLLSTAQLALDDDALHVALHARRTCADLERSGRGTLLAVGAAELHVVRLRVVRLLVDHGVTAVALEASGHEVHGIGVALAPMTFAVSERLVERDRWAQARAALALLARAEEPG